MEQQQQHPFRMDRMGITFKQATNPRTLARMPAMRISQTSPEHWNIEVVDERERGRSKSENIRRRFPNTRTGEVERTARITATKYRVPRQKITVRYLRAFRVAETVIVAYDFENALHYYFAWKTDDAHQILVMGKRNIRAELLEEPVEYISAEGEDMVVSQETAVNIGLGVVCRFLDTEEDDEDAADKAAREAEE